MQNSPQFVIAYYAVLRADAVVVPVNPMNLTEELRALRRRRRRAPRARRAGTAAAHRAAAGRRNAGKAHRRELWRIRGPGHGPGAAGFLQAAAAGSGQSRHRALARGAGGAQAPGRAPGPARRPCALPYTSGTTGMPKGCMHTHRTLMANVAPAGVWSTDSAQDVILCVVPFFHITGMVHADAQHAVPRRGDGDHDALGPRARAENDRAPPGHRMDQHPDHGDRSVRQPEFQVGQPDEPARHRRRRRGHARGGGEETV